ncbi:hypothetical protein LXL04_028925 [Taraxacum kok-saghyz]
MGGDAKGDSKSSDSDSSTWDFGGEDTQIVDSQCFDSPTSLRDNKLNGDDADNIHILQSTIPFDDTAIFEDDLATQVMDLDGETQVVDLCGETQEVNFDTEVDEMDILDSIERNATQLFHDSDTEEFVTTDYEETQKIEIVDDSDDDDSNRKEHKSKIGTGLKMFTSVRAASLRASGLAARNKASQINKLTSQPEAGSSRSGFGRSTARKLFAEETPPEGNDNIDLCGTGLTYLDSQEPGESSQQNALDFVDNFLKVNTECTENRETNKSSERKSKPVLSAKGIQKLAKSSNLFDGFGEIEVFDWDDDREDEEGEFFKRKKDVFFASSSKGRKGRKLGESRSNKNGLVCSDSKLGLTNCKANGKSKLGFENDVRFDTQMAAEAMEDLCFQLQDTTKDNEAPKIIPKGPHKSQLKEKAVSNGVRTRQSKSKSTGQSQTHETSPHKQSKSAPKRGKVPLKRKKVDAVTSVDQKSVKTRRTRQKVKDFSEEINIPTKGKRTEVGCQSMARITRSKDAVLNEDKDGENIELIPSTCTTPVSHGTTPLKETSPIIMGDEYLKQQWKKSRIRSSVIQQQPPDNSLLTPFGSPTKNTRKRRDTSMIRVLFSRHLDPEIVNQQKKILSRLKASEASLMSEATHFIADEFTRTKNMLEAIAYGKPVVTHSWLDSCRQAHCHIDETNFILRDAKKETEFAFSLPASLAHARKSPIFKGYRVLITPNTKPGKEILASLVKAVGGVVVERLGRAVVNGDDKDPEGLILSCEEDYNLCLSFLEKGAAVYSSELLLNGIVTQRLEYDRHRLFLDHVKRTRKKTRSQLVKGNRYNVGELIALYIQQMIFLNLNK